MYALCSIYTQQMHAMKNRHDRAHQIYAKVPLHFTGNPAKYKTEAAIVWLRQSALILRQTPQILRQSPINLRYSPLTIHDMQIQIYDRNG